MNIGILFVVVIAAAGFIYYGYKQHKESEKLKEIEAEDATDDIEEKPLIMRDARNILLQSLRELQCEPEDDEKENMITFTYQSEHFAVRYDDKNRFLHLLDLYWYSCDGADVDQVAKIKKVINDINWRCTVNLSYTYDDNGKMHIHTTYQMLCVEQMNFTEYLTSILQECFQVHNLFFRELVV